MPAFLKALPRRHVALAAALVATSAVALALVLALSGDGSQPTSKRTPVKVAQLAQATTYAQERLADGSRYPSDAPARIRRKFPDSSVQARVRSRGRALELCEVQLRVTACMLLRGDDGSLSAAAGDITQARAQLDAAQRKIRVPQR